MSTNMMSQCSVYHWLVRLGDSVRMIDVKWIYVTISTDISVFVISLLCYYYDRYHKGIIDNYLFLNYYYEITFIHCFIITQHI